MKRLALLGASGHGKVVADIAEELGWGEIFFFDDAWPHVNKNSHWQVIGDTAKLLETTDQYDGVVVAIGDCIIRYSKFLDLKDAGATLLSLVHPGAVISKYAEIGLGSVVMAGAVINADTVIGDGCIINTGSTVDHDCVLSNAVHISPGAHLSGDVVVGQSSWIGVGASIRQGIKIGSFTTIGAGAIVVKDIDDNSLAYGNPALTYPLT